MYLTHKGMHRVNVNPYLTCKCKRTGTIATRIKCETVKQFSHAPVSP